MVNIMSNRELANAINLLAYEIDTYEYNDSVSDANENIKQIETDLNNGKAVDYIQFFDTILEESDLDEELERRVLNLLEELHQL